MIKAIFFDVDGTLLSHRQNAVPVSTRNVLNLLKEQGIKCVLATGGHLTELAALPINDISFDAYITLNGQLCLNDKKEIFSCNPISCSDKEYIVQLFRDKSIPVMLVEKDRMYINFINDAVKAAQQEISTPVPDVQDYKGGDIYQAIVYIGKETPSSEVEYDFIFHQKHTCYDTYYPFQILSKHGFCRIDFEPVTILYGGNGSGKTTGTSSISRRFRSFFGCQFIIATHSPFLLSMPQAKIYDLDEEIVDVKKWYELENVKAYYDFFKKHEQEFTEGKN